MIFRSNESKHHLIVPFTPLFQLLIAACAGFAVLLIIPTQSIAQDYERMRAEVRGKQQETRETIDFLRKQIERIETEVTETATEYDELYRQFEQLERELALRDEMVTRLEEEARQISDELSIVEQSYNEYTEDLERLVANYRKFMRQVYMQGNQSELMLLITSESFNQAQIRRYYLSKFSEYRERQAELIRQAREKLKEKEEDMKIAQRRNQEVLAESRQERSRMESRKQQQEQNISRLQQDRRSLEDQLEQSRSEIENLTSLFNSLIAEEERLREKEEEQFRRLEEERKRRLAEAKLIEDDVVREREVARLSEPVRRETTAAFSAEEMNVISASFSSAKGSLPWPTEEGVISRKFGNFINPVHRTSTPNPGVHISTDPRSKVHAVHDGYVIEVMAILGFDDTILVSHGGYITAYANLTEIYVRKNSVVRAGDVIGLSGDDDSTNGSSLVFLVREGNQFVNPEHWLSRSPQPIP